MEAHPFHVTRDAEVAIQELESDDLLGNHRGSRVAAEIPRRGSLAGGHPDPARYPPDPDGAAAKSSRGDVYLVEGPLDLGRLRQLSCARPAGS